MVDSTSQPCDNSVIIKNNENNDITSEQNQNKTYMLLTVRDRMGHHFSDLTSYVSLVIMPASWSWVSYKMAACFRFSP